jgi:hypothetical protein
MRFEKITKKLRKPASEQRRTRIIHSAVTSCETECNKCTGTLHRMPCALFLCVAMATLIIGTRQFRLITINNSVAWVRERIIPTERPPLVGELVPTFTDRGCHVFSVMDPYGRILAFLDRSRYFFFQVAHHLYFTRMRGTRSRPITFQKIW